jgi:hypothetical protein
VKTAGRWLAVAMLTGIAAILASEPDPDGSRPRSAMLPNGLLQAAGGWMEPVHDYGRMSLVRLDGPVPVSIANRVHVLPPSDTIGFRSWHGPAPESFALDEASGKPAILMLAGPLGVGWRRSLEAAGVKILAPADPYALVVRADATAIQRALEITTSRGFKVVTGVAVLPVEARIERSLQQVVKGRSPQTAIDLVARGYEGQPVDGIDTVDPGDLERFLTAHPEAAYVEPVWNPATHNNLAARPGLLQVEPLWQDFGYNGTGVTVAHNDTGVDLEHPDLAAAVTASVGRMAYTDNAHGTHTAGSIVGRGSSVSPVNTSGCGDLTEPLSLVRGMAWGADLVSNNIFTSGHSGVSEMMSWGVENGALVSNNSWGLVGPTDPVVGYTSAAVEADAAVRDADPQVPGDQPLTVFFSVGNLGPDPTTVTSPATAKNVLSIGATQNDRCGAWVPAHQAGPDSEEVLFSSGRGPSQGRVKPDLVAPGSDVLSPESGDPYAVQLWDQDWTGPEYAINTGTSQACALAAGAGAVFHEAYWRTRGRRPSPALVKAALINGAFVSGVDFPADRGWGRLDLAAGFLGPEGGAVTMIDQGQTAELTTGGVWRDSIVVRSPTIPLRLTVVWTDVPGEEDAAHPLVNDLDLVVTGPDGTVYRGNVLDGLWSAPDPGSDRDQDNNVEVVRVESPPAGDWSVEVVGVNVPVAPSGLDGQDFALVYSGEAGPCSAPPPPPADVGATASGDNRIDLWWSAVAGAQRYEISRSRSAGGQPYIPVAVVDAPATWFSDTDVSGGVGYHYVVRAFRECWSEHSAEASATAAGGCFLPPVFDGLQSVDDLEGVSCSLGLSWQPAAPQCGSTAVYDVYREESPGFEPLEANLVAQGLTMTQWTDIGLVSGRSYHYIVRSRDPGSDIDDGNSNERHASPSGPDDVYLEEDAEGGSGDWITEPGSDADRGTEAWFITDDDAWSGAHAWFVADEPRVKDQALLTAVPIMIPTESSPVLEFRHRMQLHDGRDGGRLEYSTNGGLDWFDILEGDGQTVPADPGRLTAGGYTRTIGSSSNPLFRADAWTGDSHGWVRSEVDLRDLAGRRVAFRWRLACDDTVALDRGWWLDDIRLVVEWPCQSCTAPPPPAGLTADPGAEGVALGWEAVTDAQVYRISRSDRSGGPYRLLAAVAPPTTTYLDATASGGSTYFYVVSVETSCRSDFSDEVMVPAAGPCRSAPVFWGLDSITDPRQTSCALDLVWRPAEPGCPGADARYRVYRSTVPGFVPGPWALLVEDVAGPRFRDVSAKDGEVYYYHVRSVDTVSGAEDDNPVQHSGWTTGPDEVLFADSVEGVLDGWWTAIGSSLDSGTESWEVVDDFARTGSRSWFCANEGVIKDQVVGLVGGFEITDETTVLAFHHLFDLEVFWDGGRLEYSTNGGSSWQDILQGDGLTVHDNPGRFLAGGYTGFISMGTGNPLAGERAWTGFVDDWTQTVIDLVDFAGLTVHFRWRLGCDRSEARLGWWLDDVELRRTTTCETASLPVPRQPGGRRRP